MIIVKVHVDNGILTSYNVKMNDHTSALRRKDIQSPVTKYISGHTYFIPTLEYLGLD